MLTHHRTTEEEKYSITNWKYEGKYSIYNEKPYEEHKRNHYGFANPQNNFFPFMKMKTSQDLLIYMKKTPRFSLALV